MTRKAISRGVVVCKEQAARTKAETEAVRDELFEESRQGQRGYNPENDRRSILRSWGVNDRNCC